jgi:hypothetical protein
VEHEHREVLRCLLMRAVTAKVIKGKVVTRAKLPEGARLTVFVHEADADVELDADDEAAIGVAMTEIRAGKYVTGAELRAFLRRH